MRLQIKANGKVIVDLSNELLLAALIKPNYLSVNTKVDIIVNDFSIEGGDRNGTSYVAETFTIERLPDEF